MRSVIWSRSKELRPGLPLTLMRVSSYTRTEIHKGPDGEDVIDKLGKEPTFATELECLGKILPLAPCKLESNAEWLLAGWLKVCPPLMDKYEIAGFVDKPKKITNVDELIRAVVTSEKYKEQHKDA